MPNAKLLPVDDTSLFYVIKNAKFSAKDLNNSLTKISNWEFQWKTNFNSDPAKQAYKKFQYKYPKKKKNLPFFNQSSVIPTTSQKHFGMVLGSQDDFKKHLQNTLNKVSKITSLPRKLQKVLPRSSLLKLRWC